MGTTAKNVSKTRVCHRLHVVWFLKKMTFVFATFTSFRYISKSFLVNSLQLVPFRQWQTPCSRLEKRLLGIVITLGLHSPFQWHDFVWSDCINICEYVISLHWNPMRTNERGKDHLMTAVISVDFSRGRNIDFWDSLTSSHTCCRSSLSLFCTQCFKIHKNSVISFQELLISNC